MSVHEWRSKTERAELVEAVCDLSRKLRIAESVSRAALGDRDEITRLVVENEELRDTIRKLNEKLMQRRSA